VAAEIICDGHHVHPSLVSMAIRRKSVAESGGHDGTAVTGRRPATEPPGDQTIIAGDKTAVLENGTLAGSILTMDAASGCWSHASAVTDGRGAHVRDDPGRVDQGGRLGRDRCRKMG
jgi:N-acetylglucosamine-6-phosphate deacetylase